MKSVPTEEARTMLETLHRFTFPRKVHWALTPPVPTNTHMGVTCTLEIQSKVLFRPGVLLVDPNVQVLQIRIGNKLQPAFEQYQRYWALNEYNVDGLFDVLKKDEVLEVDVLFLRKSKRAVTFMGLAMVPA